MSIFNLFKRPQVCGRVSILIPTMFDSRCIIELCLKSIWKNTDYPDYEIIVCDAGADGDTRLYLDSLVKENKIKLIKATDWERPKDDLARAVTTEYYIVMHDDTQIMKKDWIRRRLILMVKDPNNAIVGTTVKNYHKTNRFFPLGLLVKTAVSREIGLVWGKQPGFDTGALAYEKFFSQKKYKFVSFKMSRDIRHFSDMTWPKYHNEQSYPGVDKKMKERERKIQLIRSVLDKEAY